MPGILYLRKRTAGALVFCGNSHFQGFIELKHDLKISFSTINYEITVEFWYMYMCQLYSCIFFVRYGMFNNIPVHFTGSNSDVLHHGSGVLCC